MDLLPSPEQSEIISSAAGFLADSLPVARTRELISEPSNVDHDAWLLASQLGWFGLGLPESDGGVGGGLADEALLFREIGRSLASGPFVATVLAARVATFGGRPALAEAIIDGQGVGLALPSRHLDAAGDTVSGALSLVDSVDLPLVLLVTADRALLLSTDDLDDARPVGCIDPTTRLMQVTANRVRPVAGILARRDPIERRGIVLVAAMQTGIAEATRDVAAEHATTRIQFGRPIGVNQAVKHSCADMAVRSELAWAQTIMAALASDEQREDAAFQALAAKVVAGHAAQENAGSTVQVLGGMGFTFEHDANLYVKRAFVLDQLFGDERGALSRLIQLPAPK